MRIKIKRTRSSNDHFILAIAKSDLILANRIERHPYRALLLSKS